MKFVFSRELKIGVLGLLVLVAGCRPTIEFTSDSSNAAPGETVTLDWDVEFAKGTTSSKVTITDLGEVEPVGTAQVTVNETKDFNIRVSTFVLGMPMTAKDSVTINVFDEGLQSWLLDDSREGWTSGYALYENNSVGILCDPGADEAAFSQLPNSLGDGIKLCADNDANPDDFEQKSVLAYVHRKVSNSDDFDMEDDKLHEISFEIKFLIKFSESTCDEDYDEKPDELTALLSSYSLIVGASKEAIETKVRDDIVKLNLQGFYITDEDGEDSRPSEDDLTVDAEGFLQALTANQTTNVLAIKEISDVFPDVIHNLSGGFKSYCETESDWETKTVSLDATKITQYATNDKELTLFVGFLAKADEPDVEFYIDQIKVRIEQEDTEN